MKMSFNGADSEGCSQINDVVWINVGHKPCGYHSVFYGTSLMEQYFVNMYNICEPYP